MEVRVEVDASRLRAALSRAPAVIRRHVDGALSRGALEVAREARRRAPKAFSTLTNSIHATPVGDLHYQVAPGVNYAPWVEGGRKAGKMPGVANGLREWVKLKTGLADKPLDRMTFVIARGIGRDGIKAQPFMAPAMAASEDRLRALVGAAVERGLAEALR